MNDSHDTSVQLFWWIQKIILQIEIHSTSHSKWMILTTLLFNYSDEFKKLSYKSRFIAHHYIRNELCLRASLCLIIWPKYFVNRVLYVASSDMNHAHRGDLLLSVRRGDKYEQFFSMRVIICRLMACTMT